MSQYVIVNYSQRKYEGKITFHTRYFCGYLSAGSFTIQRWDSNKKKDAYVFENKEEALKYWNCHHLGYSNDEWVKCSYNHYEKNHYEILKLERRKK